MSSEYISSIRNTLEKAAGERFMAEMMKVEEHMRSLQEVRDRYGRLDNYLSSEKFTLKLVFVRQYGYDSCKTYFRKQGNLLLSFFGSYNIATEERTVFCPGQYEGKELRRYLSTKQIEETDECITAPHGKLYRDQNGKLCVVPLDHDSDVIYEGDRPYEVTYMWRKSYDYTADETKQIVRFRDLWTGEEKVYVTPPVNKENPLNCFFVFEGELYTLYEGYVYHMATGQIACRFTETILVISDGEEIIVQSRYPVFYTVYRIEKGNEETVSSSSS